MTDDLLERASRALREESEEGDAGVRFTRARVMAGLQQNAARRRTRIAFALPIAACFAAATAFGTMKARTSGLWQEITHSLGFHGSEEQAPPPKPKALPPHVEAPQAPPPVVEAVEAAPAAEPSPVPEAPAAEVTPTPTPKPPAPSARVATPPPKSTPEVETAPAPEPPAAPAPELNDPAHDLYRAAHRAHFVEHNFAAALTGWDAYLAAAPSGRFAPEARYNRALCLVRLGRKDDAERALRPFADGAYGAYRRDEAKALIEALQR
ncbi:MAG: hypothetical protein QM756_37390 [Polyangiaceae bacterium]